MAVLSTTFKTDQGFWTSKGLAKTEENQYLFESFIKSGQNLLAGETWAYTPDYAANSTAADTWVTNNPTLGQKYTQQVLTEVPGSNGQAWRIIDGGVHIRNWIAPTDAPDTDGTQSDGYFAVVMQNDNTVIPPSEGKYIRDYKPGLIIFEEGYTPSDMGYSEPIKVTCYVYIGDMVSDALGAGTFTGLSDTPSSYAGESLKLVRVNVGETALEFVDVTDIDTYKVKSSATDTTAGYLYDELIAGTGISISVGGAGDEKVTISVDGSSLDGDYLRLDAANSPVTGPLTITNTLLVTSTLTTGVDLIVGTSAQIGTSLQTGTFITSGSFITAQTTITAGSHLITQAQGELRLSDSDSSNYVGFRSPATVASNQIWTLPDSDGAASSVLTTDGGGILSWKSIGTLGDATYLRLDLTNDPISGTLSHHGDYLLGATTVAGSTTNIKASAYDGVLSTGGTDLGTDTQTTRDFLMYGHDYRIRQDGDIASVSLYINTLTSVTSVTLKVWRKSGSTYDMVGSAVLSGLGTGLNTDIAASITDVEEGDFLGITIVKSTGTNNQELKARAEASPANTWKTYYFNSAQTGDDVDWEGSSDGNNNQVVVPLEVKMTNAPYAVFIGDSIMEGQVTTTPFTGNMSFVNDDADIEDMENSIPYFVGRSMNVTYQNMAIGGQKVYGEIEPRFEDDVIDAEPRIIIANGGINDLFLLGWVGATPSAGDISTAKTNMITAWTSILDAADTAGIPIVVMSLTHGYDSGVITNPTLYSQSVDDWNDSLRTLVQSYDDAIWIETDVWVDQFRVGGDAGNLWDQQEEYRSDGLHFSDMGYRRLGEAIIDGMAQARVFGKVHASNLRVEHGITFDGDNTKYIQVDRQKRYDTYGNPLVIRGGGATIGATNQYGGDVILIGGISTGTGKSKVAFGGSEAGSSGVDDNPYSIFGTISEYGFYFGPGGTGNNFASYPFHAQTTGATLFFGAEATTGKHASAFIQGGGATTVADNIVFDGTQYVVRGHGGAGAVKISAIAVGDARGAGYAGSGFTDGDTIALVDMADYQTWGWSEDKFSIYKTDKTGIRLSSDEDDGKGSVIAQLDTVNATVIGNNFNMDDATTNRCTYAGSVVSIALQGGEFIVYNKSGLAVDDTFVGDERLRVNLNGSLTINDTYTLPASDGSANQVLQTNGAGQLSWVTGGGGSTSPGGSDTQVQFNDGGSFAGDSALVWDKTDNTLTIINTSKSALRVADAVDGAGGVLAYSSTTDSFTVGEGFDMTSATQLTARDTEASATSYVDGTTRFYNDKFLVDDATFVATESGRFDTENNLKINKTDSDQYKVDITGTAVTRNPSLTYSGSGPNDLTVAGTYTGTVIEKYIVKITTVNTGAITQMASGLLFDSIITSNGHGLSNGDYVEITGTVKYNGVFAVYSVTANTFNIAVPFTADEATGTWTQAFFQWSSDNGTTFNGTDLPSTGITTGIDLTDNGLTFIFSAISGKVVDDQWGFTAYPNQDIFRGESDAGNDVFVIKNDTERIGIGTNAPSYKMSFAGSADTVIGMEADPSGAGHNLGVLAGAAAGTDQDGGVGYVSGGYATGDGGSEFQIWTTTPNQGSGTASRAPSAKVTVEGGGLIATFRSADEASINFRTGTSGAPTNVEEGDMWYDDTSDAIRALISGADQALVGHLHSATSYTSYTGTTWTTLHTYSIPADFWEEGKTVQVTAYGTLSTDATPGNIGYLFRIGTTTIATIGTVALPSSLSNRGWNSEIYITCTATTATQATLEVQGQVRLSLSAADAVVIDMERTATITVTRNSAQNLQSRVDFSSSGNTLVERLFVVRALN